MHILKLLCRIATAAAFVASTAKASAQALPYNIEPERVRPQAKVDLPKIQTVPDAVDYFFEPSPPWAPKKGEPYPLVHMRIPKAPYFDRNSSNGPARKYEMYITMFYPNFSGLADRENAECSEAVKIAQGKLGFCRRELIVGFGFGFEPSHSEVLLRRNLEKDLQHGYIMPLPDNSKYIGLSLVGEQIIGDIRTTFYLSKDVQGKPEFVISCNEKDFSPICSTSFRATKSPYIYISLDFVFALLPQWREVINATRRKVDSMIVQTYKVQAKD